MIPAPDGATDGARTDVEAEAEADVVEDVHDEGAGQGPRGQPEGDVPLVGVAGLEDEVGLRGGRALGGACVCLCVLGWVGAGVVENRERGWAFSYVYVCKSRFKMYTIRINIRAHVRTLQREVERGAELHRLVVRVLVLPAAPRPVHVREGLELSLLMAVLDLTQSSISPNPAHPPIHPPSCGRPAP